MIGSTLTEEGRNKLCKLLQRNLDIIAWKPADMTGVPRHIAKHRLNVREGCSPIRQKKRGQVVDRNQAIQEEVEKLVEAGIMKEVYYHDWMSNTVMVNKHDDSWRRNAGATYQCLADKAFHKQIGRNMEVYVDDLVIKIRTEDEIVKDIEETFKTLREINMKLNPKKCTFRVEEGMFLGYKVNAKGLKTAEAEEAFKQMKQLIAELTILTAPMEKKNLLSTWQQQKIWSGTQLYVNGKVLSRPEVAGRLQKWSIKLGEHAIHYRPRVSVKGQILADFIVERPEEDSSDTPMEVFDATNNVAKYESLIAGLRIAKQMGVKNLQENVDSRLVANQVNRTYVAKEADLIRYLEKVKPLPAASRRSQSDKSLEARTKKQTH
ncbi:reverse transcriptase domain-containing protein [Tanacetum coccineum]